MFPYVEQFPLAAVEDRTAHRIATPETQHLLPTSTTESLATLFAKRFQYSWLKLLRERQNCSVDANEQRIS